MAGRPVIGAFLTQDHGSNPHAAVWVISGLYWIGHQLHHREAGLFRSSLRQILSGLALLAVLAAGRPAFADEPPQKSLAVHVVPTDSGRGRRAIDLSNPGDHFHVLIENISNDRIRLWKEWCSWGYAALSFEVVDADGATRTIAKVPGEWNKNFPDLFELAPDDEMVIEVSLDPSLWQNSPLSGSSGEAQLRMRAVFEIGPDRESEKMKVWTGRALSAQFEYDIYWTPKLPGAETQRHSKPGAAQRGRRVR